MECSNLDRLGKFHRFRDKREVIDSECGFQDDAQAGKESGWNLHRIYCKSTRNVQLEFAYGFLLNTT